MNQRNYQYLTETLANLGFGDSLNEELRTKIALGFKEFDILRDNVKSQTEYTRYDVKFAKSKNDEYDDYYFLNIIKATAHKPDADIASAEFKIFKKSGFNVNEMENLLSGRPVYRERKVDGEKEGKWYRLDTTNLDENGMAQIIPYPDNVTRLNLERELDKLNIVWKDKQERIEALRDLRSGERVKATVRENRKLEFISIEVAPQLGGLKVLNSENQVIKYTNSQAQSMKAVAENNAQSQNQQQSNFQAVGMQQGNGKITETTKQVMEAVTKPQKENKKNTPKVG